MKKVVLALIFLALFVMFFNKSNLTKEDICKNYNWFAHYHDHCKEKESK